VVVVFSDGRSSQPDPEIEAAVTHLRNVRASVSVFGVDLQTAAQRIQLELMADNPGSVLEVAEIEDAAAEGILSTILAPIYESHHVSGTTLLPSLGLAGVFEPMDVVLVLDGSGDVEPSRWNRQVAMASSILAGLPVSQEFVR
jgi:hypothetical protein